MYIFHVHVLEVNKIAFVHLQKYHEIFFSLQNCIILIFVYDDVFF